MFCGLLVLQDTILEKTRDKDNFKKEKYSSKVENEEERSTGKCHVLSQVWNYWLLQARQTLTWSCIPGLFSTRFTSRQPYYTVRIGLELSPVPQVSMKARRDSQAAVSCECGCWETNLGSLEEQQGPSPSSMLMSLVLQRNTEMAFTPISGSGFLLIRPFSNLCYIERGTHSLETVDFTE
ncbi:hypothetical protein STEG23_001944, partial [Scotinomys teguina]